MTTMNNILTKIALAIFVAMIMIAALLVGLALGATGFGWVGAIIVAAVFGYVFWQTLIRR